MRLVKDVYESAKVVSAGSTLITVNEFTDQLPALRPEVLYEVACEVVKSMDLTADKIVTEEDKGAPFGNGGITADRYPNGDGSLVYLQSGQCEPSGG